MVLYADVGSFMFFVVGTVCTSAGYNFTKDTISQRIQFHKVHSVAAGYLPWPSMMSNHPCLLLVPMVIQVGICKPVFNKSLM